MCGIVGIWNQRDEAIISRMAQSVAHRGPDGLTWMTKDNSSLGSSRLAIFGDPTASAIFYDTESNVAILLNGEIYNVNDLRTQLETSGAVFRTNLESEVVAKLYLSHGLDFAKHLKGMFALAILDGDRLVLARDRFGIKPLYYANMQNNVIFGSEIKAILSHPKIKAELDPDTFHEILVFGYVFSLEKTIFKGVSQVEPGTVIEFSKAARSISKFSHLPRAHYLDEGNQPDYATTVAQLRELIIETVDILLSHGNQPVGIYLSGGLDSTILTLVSRAMLGHPVTTFTLSDDYESPDLLAAREVSRKLGTKHVERRVTLQDYFAKLGHFIKHYESLVAGGVFDIHGNLAFHLISETVAEHVRVAFSGDGADELFGGYYWIYTHPLGFADRIRNRLQLHQNGNEGRKLVDRLFPIPEDERTYRRNVFDALMQGGLVNYHLQSVDRSAGAFGFEIRPAYLFDDLADFALNLPIEYKVPDKKTTKRILRDAFRPEFERLGLNWVLTRQKEGMPAAVSYLAPLITQKMETTVKDSIYLEHPMRSYFPTKFDMYLFQLFAETFLPMDNHVEHCRTPQ